MKRRFVVFMRPDQYKKLEALSQESGAPISELVRRAIDAMLEGKRKKKKVA